MLRETHLTAQEETIDKFQYVEQLEKFEFDNPANYIETWKPLKSYYFDSKSNCCTDYCNRCVTLADEPLKMRA